MEQTKYILRIQEAIKLVNGTEDDEKFQGLSKLAQLLDENDDRLIKLGYRLVFLKEITKLVTFDSGKVLEESLLVLESHYFKDLQHLDELAEMLIYRIARSTDLDTCKLCLSSMSKLIDYFDDRIAKHSKQILKLADLNDLIDLNPLLSEILLKMKQKLPQRREI